MESHLIVRKSPADPGRLVHAMNVNKSHVDGDVDECIGQVQHLQGVLDLRPIPPQQKAHRDADFSVGSNNKYQSQEIRGPFPL